MRGLFRKCVSSVLSSYVLGSNCEIANRNDPTGICGVLTVECDNTDNETDAQHHDDERVDLEAGALVGVELEHRRAAAACTGGAGARRTGIGDFVGAVGGCATTDGSCRASGGFGRGGACGCAAGGGGGDGGVGGLGGLVVSWYVLGGVVLGA